MMPFKTCQHCGRRNPRFLTHCLFCGEPLLEKRQKAGKILAALQLIVFLCLAALFIVFILVPAVQFAVGAGQDFSETVLAKQAGASQPVLEYPLHQEAMNSDLGVAVSAAQDGQYTFHSNKFFLVTVQLRSLRAEGNLQIPAGNFELIDSKGARYLPYGIGSAVLHDLGPLQSSSAQLTYIIPQDVKGEKVRFTFPGENGGAAGNVVLFTI